VRFAMVETKQGSDLLLGEQEAEERRLHRDGQSADLAKFVEAQTTW
jgi:hypothetical protein